MRKVSTIDPLPALITLNFGKVSIGLNSFDLTFDRNALTETNVSATLTVPGFKKDEGGEKVAVVLDVDASFDAEGDFEVSAFNDPGVPMGFEDIFNYSLKELTIGKQDDKYYLETSGTLTFTHPSVASIIGGNFEIQDLRIWQDGKIELKGGTIPLGDGIKIKFGPAEIFITAIHFGSIQKQVGTEMRKYNYWGFDGGVSVDPGGVDARGTGIKFCYTVDGGPFDSYITMDSISLDLIIPGKASPEDAAIIISGWLAISRETFNVGDGETIDVQTYAGGLGIMLPKAKIAANADMKFAPDLPAFIIDLSLELPSPIPLGPTGMGIYGFRGLFGHHFVASRDAVGLTSEDEWYDYYKAAPEEGVHVQKFKPPFSPDGELSGFSAGAGVSLATAADSGKAFSSKIFLMLSLPDVFFLQGQAAILSERVGLSSEDPPFFAYLAVSKKEIETGFGLSFKVPKDTGKVLDAYASMQAAFFFHNPKAWYINIGTREEPNTARILDFITAESFLMLSASGMELGAKAELGFERSYLGGSLHASVGAYLETGGFISFEQFQIGAYIATGGHADVSVCGFGFYLYFDTYLGAEAPKPLLIEGNVDLSVGFKILGKKISKDFTVEFKWEKSKSKVISYVSPVGYTPSGEFPVKAINMLSGEAFDVEFIQANASGSTISKLIPCDSYIDIEFRKFVNPTNVSSRIGSVASVGDNRNTFQAYEEPVPPESVNVGAKHSYNIDGISVEYWDTASSIWRAYNPYEAVSTPLQTNTQDAINFNSANLQQLGHWQLQGAAEYNRLRLLSQSPFSYMDNGMRAWATPEVYGVTPKSIFCADIRPENEYANFTKYETDAYASSGSLESLHNRHEKIRWRLKKIGGKIIEKPNNYNIDKSLAFTSKGEFWCKFLNETAYASIKLFTYSKDVTISYYAKRRDEETGRAYWAIISQVTKTRYEALSPIIYDDPENPIRYVSVQPATVDHEAFQQLLDELYALIRAYYEGETDDKVATEAQIAVIKQNLEEEYGYSYDGDTLDETLINEQIANATQTIDNLTTEVDSIYDDIEDINALYNAAKDRFDNCGVTIRPSSEKTQTEICIENLTDIVPEGVSVTRVQEAYDAYMESIGIIATGVATCKNNYKNNADDVTNDAKDYLDALLDAKEKKKKEAEGIEKKKGKAIEDLQNLKDTVAGGLNIPPIDASLPDRTIIHEIEWMSKQAYDFNQNILSQEAVEREYQEGLRAIEHNLSPIWRPYTQFRIKLNVSDTISTDGYTINDKYNNNGHWEYHFGFKTGGPVGFFHEDYNTSVGSNEDNWYVKPEAPGTDNFNLQKYKLATLRDYIDYERSYPFADGNIINAKPLYYHDTKLNLFYTKPYVYHMLNNWEPLGGLPAINDTFEVVVKDPIEDYEIANPPPPNVTVENIPETVVGWNPDDEPNIPHGINAWDVMRNPDKYGHPNFISAQGKCWADGGLPIKPASLQTTVTLSFLRPSTLYTAIFYNTNKDNPNTPVRKQVHRYVFQTSRYSSFQEHMETYILKDKNGENPRQAVFNINISVNTETENKIINLLENQKSGDTNLDSVFTHPFDCLIEGVLDLSPLAPAETVEFNVVRNLNTDTNQEKILGIIVRSPEPFVNPKLPDLYKQHFCNMYQIDYAYRSSGPRAITLFSKDCSQFFVTPEDTYEIEKEKVGFGFYTYEWNGRRYSREKDQNGDYVYYRIHELSLNQ
ncbi:MAG: hypothetical protein PF481_06895 [Bacteroidales bacterium]|nr:hypothetical protein [Bacteroidales bacterium]